ncbi:MAG: DUF3499 family protein [Acidimicrobiales bacterium]
MDLRHCARPACSAPTAAVMTYDYARRVVWLDRPGDESAPVGAWGLCDHHAEGLSVPLGWRREDRRRMTSLPTRIAV